LLLPTKKCETTEHWWWWLWCDSGDDNEQ